MYASLCSWECGQSIHFDVDVYASRERRRRPGSASFAQLQFLRSLAACRILSRIYDSIRPDRYDGSTPNGQVRIRFKKLSSA